MSSCSGCVELFLGCFRLLCVVYIFTLFLQAHVVSWVLFVSSYFLLLSVVRFCRSSFSLCKVVLVCL